ncbi:DsbA family protein [Luteipulveratus halotolerans]|uniref:DSBA oxidoreductase n=1 Tax=Luteipulveratus halotolerans TaxID=1631356 RepID=A0A0L6CDX1_9MICO|nr:thioredoxin domain-containing protein [Luteipulveratus halotolerans]KNX35884.1 DSBA oxidoreductase [Luteipulveratus halotolerans]
MTRRNSTISAALVAVFIIVLGAILLASRENGADADEPASASSSRMVRDDSHRLGAPAADGKVTLVEFLDFECESCRAAYPFVEQLRKDYAGKVTFVMRYFPIPAHKNAMNAAVAVEAASQQRKLEPMYQKMYETQAQWGEKQESKAPLFRTFAEQLGLNMTAYDKAVADPKTKQRVERDRQDGLELGVEGTPTFFLNGKLLQPSSLEDFRASVDDAVKR